MLVAWLLFLLYCSNEKSRKRIFLYLLLCFFSWSLFDWMPYFFGKLTYCEKNRCLVQGFLSRASFPFEGESEAFVGRYVLLKARKSPQSLEEYRYYFMQEVDAMKLLSIPSFHRYLYQRNPETYGLIFSNALKEYDLYHSLLFKASLYFIRNLSRRFTFNEKPYMWTFFLAYGFLMPRSLYYWHSILQFLSFSSFERILVLNFLYPHIYRHRGFQIYEGFYLLRRLSMRYECLSSKLFKMQMIFYQFHRWHLLSPLILSFRSLLAILFVFLLSISFLFPSVTSDVFTFLEKIPALEDFFPSWIVYGSISILSFLILGLCRNKKQQVIFLLFLFLWNTYPPYAKVCFFDVGQGDSTLISLPFQARNYLFDTGRAFAYASLKKDLHAQGIGKLDALLISHEDLDHSENKASILEDFRVNDLIERKQPRYEIFEILLSDKNFEDENENSLILSFSLWNWRFLMTGDAYRRQEKMLLRQALGSYDVLKLGHHGSKTSSDYQFIARVQARFGIVSASSRFYQHPHPEVLKNLKAFNTLPLLTEKEGSICFYLWPKIGIVRTKAGGFAIIWKGEADD